MTTHPHFSGQFLAVLVDYCGPLIFVARVFSLLLELRPLPHVLVADDQYRSVVVRQCLLA